MLFIYNTCDVENAINELKEELLMAKSDTNIKETDLIKWMEGWLKKYRVKLMDGLRLAENYGPVEFPITNNEDFENPVGIIFISGIRVFVVPKSSPTDNKPATVLLTDGQGHSSLVENKARINLPGHKEPMDINFYWCNFGEDEGCTEFDSTIKASLVVDMSYDTD